jgi:hypothetical protein
MRRKNPDKIREVPSSGRKQPPKPRKASSRKLPAEPDRSLVFGTASSCRVSRNRKQSEQRLARLPEVTRLYLHGWTVQQLATRFHCTEATIYNDLNTARELWRQRAVQDTATWVAEQLARLDECERAAWEGWQRSLEKEETNLTENASNSNGSSTRTRRTVKETTGRPEYLKTILGCIAERSRLLKLTEPETIRVMQDTVVEVVVSSREEVNSMLTFDDFKKLQQNTVDATPNLINSGVTHGESPSASHPDMEQAAGVPPK